MSMPELAQSGLIEGKANEVAPRYIEQSSPHNSSNSQHNGNEQPAQSVYHRNSGTRIERVRGFDRFFNAAAWQNGKDLNLLGRKISNPEAVTDSTPDEGILVLFTMDKHNRVSQKQEVWRPGDTRCNFEDPRAVVLKDGSAIIGLTAISKTRGRDGEFPFFPARARVDSAKPDRLEEIEVITQYGQGKNMTPFGVPGEEEIWWGFRPDGFDHELLVLRENKWSKKRELQAVGALSLPKDIPGFTYRAGTSAPPVWRNERNGILSIHGIEIKQGLYIYAQGLAGIKRMNTRQQQPFVLINPADTLHPKDFDLLKGGDRKSWELHPKVREAVYYTGAIVSGDQYTSIMNVGDTRTVVVYQNFPDIEEKFKSRRNNRDIVVYPRY